MSKNFKLLKIKIDYFNLLFNGKKNIEVRKLNKDYICLKDIVIFVDYQDYTYLGYGKVSYKNYFRYSGIIHDDSIDNFTKEFVIDNYHPDDLFVVFGFKKIYKIERSQ